MKSIGTAQEWIGDVVCFAIWTAIVIFFVICF